MVDRQLMKLRGRGDLSPEEEQALRGSVADTRELAADKLIARAGEVLNHSTLLLDGFACRYKDLRDGRRQITQLHIGGDFVDLHSFTLKRLDHSIMALSPVRIALVPHERLEDILRRFPNLARLLWHSTNIDAAIHREWELSLGQRDSASRMAALFCELHARLEVVGLTRGNSYDLPLTQEDLAECLGITAVHSNRVLQDLRKRDLLQFRSGRVTIIDMAGLVQLGEFDPGYLYIGRPGA